MQMIAITPAVRRLIKCSVIFYHCDSRKNDHETIPVSQFGQTSEGKYENVLLQLTLTI